MSEPIEQQATEEPHGTEEATDFEAKYKEALAQSRKWEERAKANKDKADKWDAYEQEGLSETEKAIKRAEQAEAQLAELVAERDHEQAAVEVAAKTGAPVDYLRFCNSREAMEQLAEKWQVEHGEQSRPAAASVPSTRYVRPDGAKPANRDVFAEQFSDLFLR